MEWCAWSVSGGELATRKASNKRNPPTLNPQSRELELKQLVVGRARLIIVGVSGMTEDEDRAMFFDSGIDAIVTKPFSTIPGAFLEISTQ